MKLGRNVTKIRVFSIFIYWYLHVPRSYYHLNVCFMAFDWHLFYLNMTYYMFISILTIEQSVWYFDIISFNLIVFPLSVKAECVCNCIFNFDHFQIISVICLSPLQRLPISLDLMLWYVSIYFCPFLDGSQWWIRICAAFCFFSLFVWMLIYSNKVKFEWN